MRVSLYSVYIDTNTHYAYTVNGCKQREVYLELPYGVRHYLHYAHFSLISLIFFPLKTKEKLLHSSCTPPGQYGRPPVCVRYTIASCETKQ
jgi:hypothetical protein